MDPWIEQCADQLQGTKWSAESIIACIQSYHAACSISAVCAAKRVLELEAEVERLKAQVLDEMSAADRYYAKLEHTAPTTAPRQS